MERSECRRKGDRNQNEREGERERELERRRKTLLITEETKKKKQISYENSWLISESVFLDRFYF